MKTLLTTFASAFIGATVAVGLIHVSPAAGALLAPPKMKVTEAGTVPTELGELVHAGGDANQKVLFFVDTAGTISIVKVTNKVSQGVTQITRSSADESGSTQKPKKAIGKMQLRQAGAIPAEWGELVAVNATRNDATLFFQNEESKIHAALVRANNLTPAVLGITREY